MDFKGEPPSPDTIQYVGQFAQISLSRIPSLNMLMLLAPLFLQCCLQYQQCIIK